MWISTDLEIYMLHTVDSFIFVGTNFHGFMKNDLNLCFSLNLSQKECNT